MSVYLLSKNMTHQIGRYPVYVLKKIAITRQLTKRFFDYNDSVGQNAVI